MLYLTCLFKGNPLISVDTYIDLFVGLCAGMHNLGNTCFMNCVFQVNIQFYFRWLQLKTHRKTFKLFRYSETAPS